MFQLCGRFIMGMEMDVSSQFAGTRIVLVGLVEFMLRVMVMDIEHYLQKLFCYKISANDEARLKTVLAHDAISTMIAELSAIGIAFACRFFFYKHRLMFDLGYVEGEPPVLWGRELGMMVFALAVEIIVDLAAMTAELWRELPLKEVWKCKTKLHMRWAHHDCKYFRLLGHLQGQSDLRLLREQFNSLFVRGNGREQSDSGRGLL